MRKSLLLVAPLLFGMLLTSCGETTEQPKPSDDKPSTSETKPSEDKPSEDKPTEENVKIEFWSTIGQNNQPWINDAIAAFKEVEPNIEVVPVFKGGSYDQLKDSVAQGFSANNYPDIVQCYPDHVAEYIGYNKAVDLDPFISNPEYGLTAEDKADYLPAFLEEGQKYALPGTYSMPFCKSTEAMFYNQDVLLGLDLTKVDPTINGGAALTEEYINSLTWEELFGKLCPAILEYNKTNKIINDHELDYQAVLGYDSDDNLFITLAEQYGYKYTSIDQTTGKGSVDFDNPEMKALMKKFLKARENHYMVTKGYAGGKYVNELFTKQNILFSVGSTGGIKYQFSNSNPMNVGVAPIPHHEGAPAKVISQGPSLCVLDHGSEARQIAAWKFYKFLTNEENALSWALESGYSPVRSSAYESDEFLDLSNAETKDAKSYERMYALSKAYESKVQGDYYTSPAFNGSSACRKQAGGIVTSVLSIDTKDKDDAAIEAEIAKIFKTAHDQALKDIK